MDINVNVSGNVTFTLEAAKPLMALLLSAGIIQAAGGVAEAAVTSAKNDDAEQPEKPTKTRKKKDVQPEEPEAKTEPEPVETEVAAKPAAKGITLEQVNELVISKTQKDENNRVTIKQILTDDYMVAGTRSLQPEDYAEFMAKIKDL